MKIQHLILDIKLFTYRLAKHIAPAKFTPKYNRNYIKRHLPSKTVYTFLSHREENQDFSALHTDIKLMAYYLPQFHTFPENDEWWGKGFTEWCNTRPAQPLIAGHYQPRQPHKDIGYYDLSDVNVMAKQAALAKQHGIYGFCMYYYWFSGKKLMEKPLDNLMKHPEIDFPFCLCWANESWSRRWNGSEKLVLIKQQYREQDPLLFIQDIAPYLKDKRYIRVNQKPIILIYNIQQLPNPQQAFQTWREWCRQNGIGEIEIWAVRSFLKKYSQSFADLVDKEVEFPPHLVTPDWILERIQDKDSLWIDYQVISSGVLHPQTAEPLPDDKKPIIRAAMLGWDNTARYKKKGAHIYNHFSLFAYYQWLRYLISYTRKKMPKEERFLFVNAWNEWAEGTYLEPDRKYAYANINVTSRAIFDLPFEPVLKDNAVIIACLESLGDIIACEPVIQSVQEKYPGRPIYWALSVQYADVLQAHPALAGILPFYTMQQWQNFKNNLPPSIAVVDLHFQTRHYLLANTATYTVAYNHNRSDITEENYYTCGNSLLDIFSKVAGLASTNEAPHFYIAPFAQKPANLPKRYIAAHTQAFIIDRNWDKSKWEILIKELAKDNIAVVEIGQNSLLKGLPGCTDCTNLPSIHDTATVLAGAELFVGIDSSMAHLANALNIPGVILLGKYRNFTHYMPYSGKYQDGTNAIVLYAPKDKPAAEISVSQVYQSICQMLQRKSKHIETNA